MSHSTYGRPYLSPQRANHGPFNSIPPPSSLSTAMKGGGPPVDGNSSQSMEQLTEATLQLEKAKFELLQLEERKNRRENSSEKEIKHRQDIEIAHRQIDDLKEIKEKLQRENYEMQQRLCECTSDCSKVYKDGGVLQSKLQLSEERIMEARQERDRLESKVTTLEYHLSSLSALKTAFSQGLYRVLASDFSAFETAIIDSSKHLDITRSFSVSIEPLVNEIREASRNTNRQFHDITADMSMLETSIENLKSDIENNSVEYNSLRESVISVNNTALICSGAAYLSTDGVVVKESEAKRPEVIFRELSDVLLHSHAQAAVTADETKDYIKRELSDLRAMLLEERESNRVRTHEPKENNCHYDWYEERKQVPQILSALERVKAEVADKDSEIISLKHQLFETQRDLEYTRSMLLSTTNALNNAITEQMPEIKELSVEKLLFTLLSSKQSALAASSVINPSSTSALSVPPTFPLAAMATSRARSLIKEIQEVGMGEEWVDGEEAAIEPDAAVEELPSDDINHKSKIDVNKN